MLAARSGVKPPPPPSRGRDAKVCAV